jgi:hypothetical protein
VMTEQCDWVNRMFGDEVTYYVMGMTQ